MIRLCYLTQAVYTQKNNQLLAFNLAFTAINP